MASVSSEMESPSNSSHLRSPVRVSPSKIALNRSAFMANTSNHNSPTKQRDGSVSGNTSSTKVIEALYQQIDTLTNTNLQLTVQSNNLLTKLENANSKEAKQLETVATLKHENENLNSMLNRKSRRCKDLEDQLVQLRNSYEETAVDYRALKQNMESTTQREAQLQGEIQILKVQYDALLDSQKRYREHYEQEIHTLNLNLEKLKKENDMFITKNVRNILNNSSALQTKLNQYTSKYKDLEALNLQHIGLLSEKVDKMASQMDLPAWEKLYKDTRDIALDYAKKMDLSLEQDVIEEHGRQGTFASKFLSNAYPSPETMAPPLRVPKTRSTSGKRSSFYGGNVTVPGTVSGAIPSSSGLGMASTVTPTQGSLPGLKRSSSTRKPSSNRNSLANNTANSRSTSGESTEPESSPPSQQVIPDIPQRNSLRRTTSNSQNKKKRYSMHKRDSSSSSISGN